MTPRAAMLMLYLGCGVVAFCVQDGQTKNEVSAARTPDSIGRVLSGFARFWPEQRATASTAELANIARYSALDGDMERE